MEFKFKVATKIQKPLVEVFDAVYNPKKLSQYFATAGASAPLVEGTVVNWRFADCDCDAPVKVSKVVPNQLIAFSWEASDAELNPQTQKFEIIALKYDTHVEVRFEALDASNTLVSISEGTWHENEQGLKSSYGNCMGWTNMLGCLKAYVEYGINLRKGAF
jgi:uncharacterized protein YndB with AHSA1/START domain